VRSKVSRVKEDMRTIGVALEAYAVDKNRVPREVNTLWYAIDVQAYGDAQGILWWGLTTPLPYLTRVNYIDPFQDTTIGNRLDERLYTYHDLATCVQKYGGTFWPAAVIFYGGWRLGSVGPDRMYSHPNIINSAQLVYDPTNGTVSLGNIWRSQKYSYDKEPPVGPLIGPH